LERCDQFAADKFGAPGAAFLARLLGTRKTTMCGNV
jgi:hypothetical protein